MYTFCDPYLHILIKVLTLPVLHFLMCISNVEALTLPAHDFIYNAHLPTLTIVGTLPIYFRHVVAITRKIHEITAVHQFLVEIALKNIF